MRILLAHNSLYFPSHGGGDKSNRLLMEALAALGHSVLVVARVEDFGEAAHLQLAAELVERRVSFSETEGAIRFEREGVDVLTLTRSPHLRAFFAAQIEAFDPDVIVTSTDDPAQLLFDLAIRAPRARVVYLVRATIAAPFGPDSSMPNPTRTAALKHADGVVGVSEYVAQYAREWGGFEAVHVPISLMGSGATNPLGSFANRFVTMVNPCAVKGISIFLALAEALPAIEFAAVPTWGTTPEEFELLRKLPNVTLLPAADDISQILQQTRVMLVPSVWAEARSRMVMEAMLRRIPVMASDAGGLREAKLGVPYLLPVNPIRHYQAAVDQNMVPIAEVPPQDVEPWIEALQRLTSDETHWRDIADQSREAALRYLETLTANPFAEYLEALTRKPKKQVQPGLSEEKKRLLALRMKQRAKPSYFPRCAAGVDRKVFCFPHAGAGTLAFRGWVIPGFTICPALYPGREDRATEPPIEQMEELVAALAGVIRPLVNERSLFFGHSMGAGVAFELVRALRRSGGNLPGALVVSGARSPQYRLTRGSVPDVTDEEVGRHIHHLGVPILRADLRLYRNYSYAEEPPLPIPIFAYSGSEDPNVTAEQLGEWAVQTSAFFRQRTFPGDHFYPKTNSLGLLEALTADAVDIFQQHPLYS